MCTNLDYSAVDDGVIACRDCPRVWQLVTRVDKEGTVWSRWRPIPCPGCSLDPCRCRPVPKKTLTTRK